ncbi:Prestalk A differentiation A [Fusarium albosuccineum]|uniref:Prestalk A differentiation A n=1 Tax=Fusarium albosuccineum TaxID=1237068 RepID=A0A8H4PIX0_9HYPO|nr:Prestalk A differentiation A [Fusarium albosuccineum]
MSRNVCITAVDGHTGFLIAELILKHRDFSRKVNSVVGLTLHPDSDRAKELKELGATIVQHDPGRLRIVTRTLKDINCGTICLVPPAHQDKFEICEELATAAKRADIPNVCLISSEGCDYAEREKQPRLREFIDLESLVLEAKGDAENLLLYAPQAKEEGHLPLPIGKNHKFAPVALGDVAHVAAHVLTGKGKHGFDDKHRGQMMVVTGPMLCAGAELATAASKALGTELQFENISEYAPTIFSLQSQTLILDYRAEARKVLKAQSVITVRAAIHPRVLQPCAGGQNYISTTAFHDVTGEHPTEPENFFQMYQSEMRPKKKAKHEHK